MATTINDRNELITALASLGVYEGAAQGVFDGLFSAVPVEDKPEVAALTAVTTANATDEASAIALANALKTKINQIITALKA